MARVCVLFVTAFMAGCGTLSPNPIKPPPERAIDFTIDVQPIIVSKEWTMDMLGQLAGQLDPAFAQAGVACRILEPLTIDNPSWEDIADERTLRAMMQSPSPAIGVWLVRELDPAVISGTTTSPLAASWAGVTFSPKDPCHGVTLALQATRDRNTLVHEMGHAFGLDHPKEGADSCSLPEVNCRFTSYCYSTRNQFNADEVEIIRRWAAVFATQQAAP